jgi:hypothetical protein
MAVLGPTMVGLFAYFSGNQGAGDATFLPDILKVSIDIAIPDFER